MAADVKAAFSLADCSDSVFPVMLGSSFAAWTREPQSRSACFAEPSTVKGSENGTVERISKVVLRAAGSSNNAMHKLAISSLHEQRTSSYSVTETESLDANDVVLNPACLSYSWKTDEARDLCVSSAQFYAKQEGQQDDIRDPAMIHRIQSRMCHFLVKCLPADLSLYVVSLCNLQISSSRFFSECSWPHNGVGQATLPNQIFSG